MPRAARFVLIGYAALGSLVVIQNLLDPHGWGLAAVLSAVIMPLTAAGIVRVRRWAYQLLGWHALASALVLAASLVSGETLRLGWAMAVTFAAAAAAYFSRPDLRAPFFAPQKRGFRAHPRVRVNLPATVTCDGWQRSGETFDLSIGGAYIAMNVDDIMIGDVIFVDISMRDEKVFRCAAHVASVTIDGIGARPEGIGVAFVHDGTLEVLRDFMRHGRRHKRFALQVPIEVTTKGGKQSLATVDVSEGGCFVAGDAKAVAVGETIKIALALDRELTLTCQATVVRVDAVPGSNKPAGFALQFGRLRETQARDLHDFLNELRDALKAQRGGEPALGSTPIVPLVARAGEAPITHEPASR